LTQDGTYESLAPGDHESNRVERYDCKLNVSQYGITASMYRSSDGEYVRAEDHFREVCALCDRLAESLQKEIVEAMKGDK